MSLSALFLVEQMPADQSMCYLAYDPDVAQGEARFIHLELLRHLGVDKSRLVLGEGEALSATRARVCHTRVLVILLTQNVLLRRSALVALYTAFTTGIAVVGVDLYKGYDFADVSVRLLGTGTFAAQLETANPGIMDALRREGIDAAVMGRVLLEGLGAVSALKLDVEWDPKIRDAALQVIGERIVVDAACYNAQSVAAAASSEAENAVALAKDDAVKARLAAKKKIEAAKELQAAPAKPSAQGIQAQRSEELQRPAQTPLAMPDAELPMAVVVTMAVTVAQKQESIEAANRRIRAEREAWAQGERSNHAGYLKKKERALLATKWTELFYVANAKRGVLEAYARGNAAGTAGEMLKEVFRLSKAVAIDVKDTPQSSAQGNRPQFVIELEDIETGARLVLACSNAADCYAWADAIHSLISGAGGFVPSRPAQQELRNAEALEVLAPTAPSAYGYGPSVAIVLPSR